MKIFTLTIETFGICILFVFGEIFNMNTINVIPFLLGNFELFIL